MGKLEPLPANDLKAWYDRMTGKLCLYAEGEVWHPVYGVRFTPLFDTDMKMPVFRLEGWLDRVNPHIQIPFPYEKTERFPGYHSPSYVKIMTADHPKGVVLSVDIVSVAGSSKPPSATVSSLSNVNVPTEELPEIKSENSSRFALVGFPFDIDVANSVDEAGSITMQYESAFLDLDNSGLVKNKVVWTFVPLRTGMTQVVVTIKGGLAQYIMELRFDVFIVYPTGPLPADPVSKILPSIESLAVDSTSTALVKMQANGVSEEVAGISGDYFNDYFQDGIRYINNNYSSPIIFGVSALTTAGFGVPDIRLLSPYTILFAAKVDGKESYITIKSFDQGVWQFYMSTNVQFPGLQPLDQPVGLSADEALKIARSRGFRGNIKSIELKKRTGTDVDQYDIFFGNGSSTTVDVPKSSGMPAVEAQNAGEKSTASANGAAAPASGSGNQLVSVAA